MFWSPFNSYLFKTRFLIVLSLLLSFIFSFFAYKLLGSEPVPTNVRTVAMNMANNIDNGVNIALVTIRKNLPSFLISPPEISKGDIVPSSSPLPTSSPTNDNNGPSNNPGISAYPTAPLNQSPFPTSSYKWPSPTPYVYLPTSYLPPTGSLPTPTTKPQPPPATPTAKLELGLVRPGKNWAEIIDIMADKFCIPKGMLWATVWTEYGAWMKDVEADWTNRNTYGWWGNMDDPRDNQWSQEVNSKVVTQMMDDTWWRIKNSGIMEQKFGTNQMSIMVTFDAFASTSYYLWNISLYRDNDCNNWPLKNMAKAFCKYAGGCYEHEGENFCEVKCKKYNESGASPQKNCSEILNTIDRYNCDFK